MPFVASAAQSCTDFPEPMQVFAFLVQKRSLYSTVFIKSYAFLLASWTQSANLSAALPAFEQQCSTVAFIFAEIAGSIDLSSDSELPIACSTTSFALLSMSKLNIVNSTYIFAIKKDDNLYIHRFYSHYLMIDVLYYVVFKIVSLCFILRSLCQEAFNIFLRKFYIAYLCDGNNVQKLIADISQLEKHPKHEITLVFQMSIENTQQMSAINRRIVKYCRIIHDSVDPSRLNIFIKSEKTEIQDAFVESLKNALINEDFSNNIRVCNTFQNAIIGEDLNRKKYETPFILCFSNYNTLVGLPYYFLVGAEIAFNRSVDSSMEYDIFASFQQYSQTEQRKGK